VHDLLLSVDGPAPSSSRAAVIHSERVAQCIRKRDGMAEAPGRDRRAGCVVRRRPETALV